MDDPPVPLQNAPQYPFVARAMDPYNRHVASFMSGGHVTSFEYCCDIVWPLMWRDTETERVDRRWLAAVSSRPVQPTALAPVF